MRIGFVNQHDARNVRSWSGILHFMAKSLEEHVGEVVYLGPDDLMPFDTGGMRMQQKIIEVNNDPERYHRLVESTRDEYERCLNWDVWDNPFALSWRTSSNVPLRFMPALRPYPPALPVDAQGLRNAWAARRQCASPNDLTA